MASGTGPEAVNPAQVPTGTGSTAARPAAPSPGPSPPRPRNEDEQARDYAKDTLPQALPLPLRDRPGHPAAARRELEPVKAVMPLGAEPRASTDPEGGAPPVRRTGNATRTVREHPCSSRSSGRSARSRSNCRSCLVEQPERREGGGPRGGRQGADGLAHHGDP
ncbi:hypothetical protein ACFWH4_11265 [Streptomyces sp. NPDC127091]|uniref:hypothetical protein n=1 Tax=Streptomyces sp. NPDC127091 TaxID=3347134 RepID=UPI0036515763